MPRRSRLYLFIGTLAALGVAVAAGQTQPPTPTREDYLTRSRETSARMEKTGLAEPFKGITTNGAVVPNLFSVRSTGVSTEPVRNAAAAFLNRSTTGSARRRRSLPTTSNGGSGPISTSTTGTESRSRK